MRTTRLACCATLSSWVMMISVSPPSPSSSKSAITDSLLTVSRLPVGSSQSKRLRRSEQRSSDRHTLLLTARELRRQVLRSMGNPDLLERCHRTFAPVGAVTTCVHIGEHHVLDRCSVAEQVKSLEYEADVPSAEGGAFLVRELRRVDPVDVIGARRGPVEAAENVQQSGLAGAGRADDRHPFSAVDDEIDAAEGMNGRIAAIGPRQASQLDHRMNGPEFEFPPAPSGETPLVEIVSGSGAIAPRSCERPATSEESVLASEESMPGLGADSGAIAF